MTCRAKLHFFAAAGFLQKHHQERCPALSHYADKGDVMQETNNTSMYNPCTIHVLHSGLETENI